MAARDYKFEYMLLNRLQCDCDYYLGHGGRNAQHCLWAHDEQKQIDKMRELYDLLPVKPEWLTREQIDEYAARMGRHSSRECMTLAAAERNDIRGTVSSGF